VTLRGEAEAISFLMGLLRTIQVLAMTMTGKTNA